MNSEKELDNLTTKELGQLFPIIICEPSEEWQKLFQTERQKIEKSFQPAEIIRIDHIGSTAIPGLKAKPTIDILLQVAENADSEKIIATFTTLGYHYTAQPENPPPHMMFTKGYTLDGFKGQAFHVHVRYKGDWNEVHFRDYLMVHHNIAKEYEELKLKFAIEYKNDREAYTNAKSEFIERVNKLMGR